METNRIIRGSYVLVTAVTLVVGWLGFWILNQTGYWFDAYIYIPLYFLVFGIFYVWALKKAMLQPPKKIVASFVGVRMTKLFSSILILIMYGALVKVHLKEFIFTFLAYYIIYLIIELGIFFLFRNDESEAQ